MRMSKNHSAVDYLWNVLYDCRRQSWSDIYAAIVNWVTQSLFKPINVAVSTKADSHTNDITKIDGNFVRIVKGSWVQLMPFQTGGPES